MLPRFRSKSIRKIGKEAKFRYVRKGGRGACCSLCHAELGGTDGKTKSSRRPSRIFGGTLCPECSVQVIKLAGKVIGGHIKLEDVDLERMKFVKCLVKQ